MRESKRRSGGPSRRVLAARRNGKRGGTATGRTHSKEWLQARATKAGTTTKERYGIDYYTWINSRRKVRKGWPKGKPRIKFPVTNPVEAVLGMAST